MSSDVKKTATPGKSSSRAWDGMDPGLSEWILEAVSSLGFQRMTPVQASTIPLFMRHKDVVVEAVTGSGKTLAFLIPIIERLLRLDEPIKKHHIGAIVIAPTRELATQINTVLESVLAFHPPSAAAVQPEEDDDEDEEAASLRRALLKSPKIVSQVLLGGTTTPAQDLSSFLQKSPNLLIATPGRLLELLSSPHVHCPQSSFEVLVMDEADRLLDLGFSETLQKILGRLPKQRRTGLFSASVSEAIDQLVRVGLRNPVRIAVKVKSANGAEDKRTPASLQMCQLVLPPQQRLPALRQILERLDPTPQKTVIYLSTCAAVDYWQHILPSILPSTFTTVPLHGKHPASVRTKNFAKFVSAYDSTVLLTTDVAARGLDIPQVDLVIQLDPPSDPKTFLHRCGRAGRAGRKGLAVVFLTKGKEEDYIEFLRIRGTPVTPLPEQLLSSDSQLESQATETTTIIRRIVLTDRAIHDKAQRAFVSWVRSYSKHAAKSIFRIQDIDWREQSSAWGLLRLPKMPEAKTFTGDRNLGLGIDWAEYAYKDPVREKRRREDDSTKAVNGHSSGPDQKKIKSRVEKTNDKAWSAKKDMQAVRETRRDKKHARRERDRQGKMSDAQKAEEREVEDLVKQVRQRNQQQRQSNDEEWTGFD